ncbi:hypothetical protein TNIN_199161 [Trichonephila inaurata madagascariensis]|uniref:Uncharacterized protein n=1 Tax=Trichonephila inaurata madagascariensis TaxID=2747483 RepID=A0A8X6WLW1_9ARAC|nr:hypothetical protein TNIN_199161 [Trichonephila inaurata madagascariensis]
MRGSLPSFLEILTCVCINEMIKCFIIWKFGKKVFTERRVFVPKQSYFFLTEQTVEINEIPVVYSFTVYKICEGLNIKVQLAPMKKKESWIKKFKKPIKKIPTVQSEIILKLCIALDLSVQLDMTKENNIQVRKQKKNSIPSKAPPMVNSVMVYKICQGLGLSARLDQDSDN